VADAFVSFVVILETRIELLLCGVTCVVNPVGCLESKMGSAGTIASSLPCSTHDGEDGGEGKGEGEGEGEGEGGGESECEVEGDACIDICTSR